MPFFYAILFPKKTFFVAFALLLTLSAAGNDGLSVIVLNSVSREAMAGVSIYNFERGFSTATNEFGEANVHTVTLEDSLTFSFIGYQPLTVLCRDLLRNNGVVLLDPGVFLQEFTVKGATRATDFVTNIPARLDIITAENIAMLNPQTSADALLNTGNVFVQKTQMGGGSPVIRGFEANKVLIVVDGVRLNNAIYRNGHLQNVITIDNNMLERIEVVHGPSAVIYGSDALGGVMSFTTRQPRLALGAAEQTFEGNAFVRFNTANQEKTGHFDFSLSGRQWAALSSFSVSEFNDLRAGRINRKAYNDWGRRFFYVERVDNRDTVLRNTDSSVQVGTGYTQFDFLQKVLFQPNKNLHFTANVQYSASTDVPRYDDLTLSTVRIVDGMRQEDFRFAESYYGPQKRLLAALSTEYKSESSKLFNALTVIAAYQKIDEDRITRRFGREERRHQLEDVHVTSLNIDFVKDIHSDFRNKKENKRFLYGFEGSYNRVNSTAFLENIVTGDINEQAITRYPDGGSDMTVLAAYFNYRQKVRQLTFTAGARYTYAFLASQFLDTVTIQLPYDAISMNTGALTGSTSLMWDAGKGWYLNLLASTAFRAPNIDDFSKVRTSGDFVLVPNPNLSPEYALNGEVNLTKKITVKDRPQTFSGTFFYTYLFDAIVRDFTTLNGSNQLLFDGDFYTTQWNTNTGTAYIYGLSANARFQLTDDLHLSSSLNYTKGHDLTADAPLAHIPPLYGQTVLAYHRKRLKVEALMRYNGWKRAQDFDLEGTDNLEFATIDGTPAWQTFNVYARIEMTKKLFLSLSIENIFDVHYRPFSSTVSAAGRSAMVALRTSF